MEFKSNVAYKLNQEDCADWIKEKQYKESIYNVISNAIADCALKRSEFAKDKIKDGVVTFDNKNYENYTAENWNALVLYNLLYYIFRIPKISKKEGIKDDTVLENFYESFVTKHKKTAYGDYSSKIEKAFNDIKQYNKELDIVKYVIYISSKSDVKEFLNQFIIASNDFEKTGVARIQIIGKNLYRNFNYRNEKGLVQGANINFYIEQNRINEIRIYGDTAWDDKAHLESDLEETYCFARRKYIFPKSSQKPENETTRQYKCDRLQSQDSCKFPKKKPERLRPYRDLPDKIRDVGMEVCLYPSCKHIAENIIDIGGYKNDKEKHHLAWIRVNESYTDKAYDPWIFDKIDITINNDWQLGKYEYIDEGCIQYVNIPHINEETTPVTITWRGAQLELNKDKQGAINCKKLVANNDSLTKLTLGVSIIKSEADVENMIFQNPNLRDLELYIDSDALKKCSTIISENKKLDDIKLILTTPNLGDMREMLYNNEELKTIRIYAGNQLKNVKTIKGLIYGSPKIRSITIYGIDKNSNIEKKFEAMKEAIDNLREFIGPQPKIFIHD